MKIYGIYKDNEHEECVFVGTAKEVANYLNCTTNNLRSKISHKHKIQHKYVVLSLYNEQRRNNL